MNIIECLRIYKYKLINLGEDSTKKKYIMNNFGDWYINSEKKKGYDGLVPKNKNNDIDSTSNLFEEFLIKVKKFEKTDINYPFLPNKINFVQENRIKKLYNGKNYELDRNKLIYLYNFIGMNNAHLGIPPIFEGVELFGSPFNTYNDEYCSPFSMEKRFNSLGSFFNYKFHKSGVYFCNPPFIDRIITNMSVYLEKIINDTKFEVIIIITIPVWDSKTQKKIGIKNYNLGFKGYENLLKSNYIKEKKVLDKFLYPYYDYYKRKYITASYTHLMILSNLNQKKFRESGNTVEEIEKKWSKILPL